MKLSEIKIANSLTSTDRIVLEPGDKFSDVLEHLIDFKHYLKKVFIANRLPGKDYTALMNTKIDKEDLTGQWSAHWLLTYLTTIKTKPAVLLHAAVSPGIGHLVVARPLSFVIKVGDNYITGDLFNNSDLQSFDDTNLGLITGYVGRRKHNLESNKAELSSVNYTTSIIQGWVLFE